MFVTRTSPCAKGVESLLRRDCAMSVDFCLNSRRGRSLKQVGLRTPTIDASHAHQHLSLGNPSRDPESAPGQTYDCCLPALVGFVCNSLLHFLYRKCSTAGYPLGRDFTSLGKGCVNARNASSRHSARHIGRLRFRGVLA